MSLTSFLQQSDVRRRFRETFALPKLVTQAALLAPPRSTHYALVGTAFDYLLRWYVQRLNPSALAKRWIAEMAAEILWLSVAQGRTDLMAPAKQARQIIQQAQRDHQEYLVSGQLTDHLLASALRLAQLDPLFRAGVIDKNLGHVADDDIADLRQLIALVEPQRFKARRLCMLNPTFGAASRLVGGADADMIIDEMIIDIKTTKYLKLERDDFNQLVGYFILHEIAGVDGVSPKPSITKLGIYFARFGYLYYFDVSDVVCSATWSRFVDWFVARAAQCRAG